MIEYLLLLLLLCTVQVPTMHETLSVESLHMVNRYDSNQIDTFTGSSTQRPCCDGLEKGLDLQGNKFFSIILNSVFLLCIFSLRFNIPSLHYENCSLVTILIPGSTFI